MPDSITEPQPENGNVIKYRLIVLEDAVERLTQRYESRHDELIENFERKISEQNKIINSQSNEITALKEKISAMQLFQTGFSAVSGAIAIIVAKLIGG